MSGQASISSSADFETNARDFRDLWNLRPGVTYLNHGSYGLRPEVVQAAQRAWQDELEAEPMDFFARKFETQWLTTRDSLAAFVGSEPSNLVLVDNATSAMNNVAHWFPLSENDEVLLSNHEYGAVHRIWERAAKGAGASVSVAAVPLPIESQSQIVEAIVAAMNKKTRLLVISHIASATAIRFPVEEITKEAHERGIAVCIDGPHAVAQLPLALDELGCDFYTASCHKWLCGPLGTGFLYVHPKWHDAIEPALKSWGRLLPLLPERWDDEFIWTGTKNPSNYFALPAAIDFLERIGLDTYRTQTHDLAQFARKRLQQLFKIPPHVPDSEAFYTSMTLHPLPQGDYTNLQARLWAEFKIEVPVIYWDEQWYVRVSCHLYNTEQEVEFLADALQQLIL